MNKKFIIGGILFWAGLSGYMGLRILESYTEDAVFAALSAVPAHAEEIHFSFLDGTLSLKGVEYEIPDSRIQHRGSIESVEVKGFNRKIIFVKPDMPSYDPEQLPLVAESVELTGIRDATHEGKDRMEREIASVDIRGWHQRLGLLLDRYHRDGVGASFYEELYRCSMDEVYAEGIDARLSSPSFEGGKADARIGRIEAVGGLKAPGLDEKFHPVTIAFSNMGFSSGDVRGTIGKIELCDLSAPDPASMEKIVELGRKITADDAADDAAVSLVETFTSAYKGERKPFSAVRVKSLNVKSGAADAKPAELDEFVFSLSGKGDEIRTGLQLSGLHLNDDVLGVASAKGEPSADLRFDLKSMVRCSNAEAETTLDFGVRGLGSLNAGLAVTGDMKKLRDALAFGDMSGFVSSDIFKYSIKNATFSYKDSGLAAYVLKMVAKESGEKVMQFYEELKQYAESLANKSDAFYASLGRALSEQLEKPGEIKASFAPEKPLSGQALAMQLMLQPSRLPVKVSSTPGAKPLQEQLN